MSAQLVAAALITGAIYALMAVSLNLIYGTMRLLNVAHGDLAMVGAYISFWAFTLYGIPPTFSFVLAMLVTGLLGVALYRGGLFRVSKGSLSADRVEANSLLVFFESRSCLKTLPRYPSRGRRVAMTLAIVLCTSSTSR